MDVFSELRFSFDDRVSDITVSEFNDGEFQIKQHDDILLIPKQDAGIFAEKLLAWISSGGRF